MDGTWRDHVTTENTRQPSEYTGLDEKTHNSVIGTFEKQNRWKMVPFKIEDFNKVNSILKNI